MKTNQLIELTYNQLVDKQFMQVVSKLANHEFTDFTVSYSIRKLLDLIESESVKAQKLLAKESARFELTPIDPENPQAPRSYLDPEGFAKMEEEFFKTPCEAGNRYKLHINSLIGIGLSPLEMRTLDRIVGGWEVLEKAELAEEAAAEAAAQPPPADQQGAESASLQ